MKKNILKKAIIVTILFASSIFAGKTPYYAPHISVKEWVSDSQYQLETLSGQPYLVEFWATWCPPCVANIPRMEKLYKEYNPKGLRIIGLSLDNDASKLSSFVKDKNIDYPIAIDAGTDRRYGVRGVPVAFLIDAAGVVVWTGHPASSSLDRAIKKVIKNSPQPVLAGIDFSDFDEIDGPVSEGETFTVAFKALRGYASRENPLKDKAKGIIEEINNRLTQRIMFAVKLSEDNKYEAAINVYEAIIKDYQGTDFTVTASEKIAEIKSKST